MLEKLFNEPVALAAVIRQGIALAIAFGLNWDTKQMAEFMLFVEGVTVFINRMLVTPNHLAEARVAAGGSPTVKMDDQPSVVKEAMKENEANKP